MLTAEQLHTIVAAIPSAQPLVWSPWTVRAGWLRAEIQGGNKATTYDLAKRIGDSENGLTVLVGWPVQAGDPWVLVVGRGQLS